MPKAISADKIRVDAPVSTDQLITGKIDPDQEYINKLTALFRQLNEMLENCPQGVSVMIELREPTVMVGYYRPIPRITATVGKKL